MGDNPISQTGEEGCMKSLEKLPTETQGTPAERVLKVLGAAITPKEGVRVNVYMQDGRMFSYEVANGVKAREHAHRIVTLGWRNVVDGVMEYYPVHQVLKVAFADPKDEMSNKYEARSR